MPAERHFATASGTAARGGSIIDMSPTKRSPVRGKFSASASNAYDAGYLLHSSVDKRLSYRREKACQLCMSFYTVKHAFKF